MDSIYRRKDTDGAPQDVSGTDIHLNPGGSPSQIPENGSPYQEGQGSNDLGGGSSGRPPTGAEIGIIVGVIAVVIIAVALLFLWRARKNKAAKDAEGATNVKDEPVTCPESSPPPPPKDFSERGVSSGETEVASSVEQPASHSFGLQFPRRNPTLRQTGGAGGL
ncbi:hypothetical protein BJ170DRAFT_681685 [Xylariales sp. AK1849]|nr:hypothetical protein BJ170DRAFT_681685 [Xylariales sp. AK1849]